MTVVEAGTGMEGKKQLPAWATLAMLAGLGKKKKKSIDRTANEFYNQHFSLPYVYSYFKVGLHRR